MKNEHRWDVVPRQTVLQQLPLLQSWPSDLQLALVTVHLPVAASHWPEQHSTLEVQLARVTLHWAAVEQVSEVGSQ